MRMNLPRVMIAGTGSGAGKTTVCCGLLGALKKRGKVSAFKCGPDYIDPMFHKNVLGVSSYNLDPFMMDENTVKYVMGRYSQNFAVIEGVMGLYDGVGTGSECSSNSVSILTETPVLLVVNVKGMSLSAAAVVNGFKNFQRNYIKGILLSGTTQGMYPRYKEIIERETGLVVCGFMPYLPEASFESRHLGLVTAGEVQGLKEKTELLASAAAEFLDIEFICKIGESAPVLEYDEPIIKKTESPVKIGIATDKAFCFYYESGLDVLRDMGAELIPFSPLEDSRLPENIQGLILGGGYPELFAGEFNKDLMAEIKKSVENGLPTVAECGGFMYLQQSLENMEGIRFRCAGALPGECRMTKKLNRFGYVNVTANEDNLLCKKGESLKAHEFHYSDSTACGTGFTAEKNGRTWQCVQAGSSLWAGYPHINFSGSIKAAERFMDKVISYKMKGGR